MLPVLFHTHYYCFFAGRSGNPQYYRPKTVYGSTKYGPDNCSGGGLAEVRLGEEERRQLEELYSLGLAKGTWSSYRTAERMLLRCCEEKGLEPALPASEELILSFIHWMAFQRGAKASTIDTYLSGVRQLHVERGMADTVIRTERVNLVLRGLRNRNNTEKRRNMEEGRLPITADILELLKERLQSCEMRGRDQRMTWTVCTLLFHGAFRVHELLCKQTSSFDPDFTLLSQDIEVHGVGDKRTLQVKIKAPKEDKKGKAGIVDVYQTGSPVCPVQAFVKWDQYRIKEEDQPLFRFSTGEPLTGKRLNEIIRERLKGQRGVDEKLFSSHSFRAGAASEMAAKGYGDEDIQSVGRWSSKAFLEYIKLPRTRRAEVAKVWGRNK